MQDARAARYNLVLFKKQKYDKTVFKRPFPFPVRGFFGNIPQ